MSDVEAELRKLIYDMLDPVVAWAAHHAHEQGISGIFPEHQDLLDRAKAAIGGDGAPPRPRRIKDVVEQYKADRERENAEGNVFDITGHAVEHD